MQGSVTVSRVPGELHVVPTSRGHSLNMANVNMTHVLEAHARSAPQTSPWRPASRARL